MTIYAAIRINEKKCATCSYWGGERQIRFNANKPYTINARAGNAPCIADKNKRPTSGTTCLKWRVWEKIK